MLRQRRPWPVFLVIALAGLLSLAGCGQTKNDDVRQEVLKLQTAYAGAAHDRDVSREVWRPLGKPARSWTETYCSVDDHKSGLFVTGYVQDCVLRLVDIYDARGRTLEQTTNLVDGQRGTPGALLGLCEPIRIPNVSTLVEDASWWIQMPKSRPCGIDVIPRLGQPRRGLVDPWKGPVGYVDRDIRVALQPGTYVVVAIERRSQISLGCGFGFFCSRPVNEPVMPSGTEIRKRWTVSTPGVPVPTAGSTQCTNPNDPNQLGSCGG